MVISLFSKTVHLFMLCYPPQPQNTGIASLIQLKVRCVSVGCWFESHGRVFISQLNPWAPRLTQKKPLKGCQNMSTLALSPVYLSRVSHWSGRETSTPFYSHLVKQHRICTARVKNLPLLSLFEVYRLFSSDILYVIPFTST